MGSLEDFQGFGKALENELGKLDRHHGEDLPLVKRFITKTDKRVAESTLSRYLKDLRKTAERLDDRPISTLTEPEMDAHVYDLRHNPEWGVGGDPLSDATVRNVEFVVRKFLTTVLDDEDHWAYDYELTPQPENRVTAEDMLRADDIHQLTRHATNLRDIAIIEFLADTGARLSLLGSLRVGDVDLDGEKPTFTPNPEARGLKGADITEYPIIDSAAILRNYLHQVHPRPGRDDVAFFHKMPGHGNDIDEGDGALTPNPLRRQIQRAADRAGIDKPVNPHNFRHSAITRMAREGYTRSQIEHRVHWTVDTDMWETYEHISGDEHNDDIFARAGVTDAEDSGPSAERKRCGNCLELVSPGADRCTRCGQPVSPRAQRADRELQDRSQDTMVSEDNRSVRELAAEIGQAISEDPRALDAFVDELERARNTD